MCPRSGVKARRVYTFAPNTFDEESLTLDLAERAGILTAETRLQAEAAGLVDSDMVRMYQTFW